MQKKSIVLTPAPAAEGISEQATSYIFGTKVTPDELADLNKCLALFEITTPQRKRHFLSQIAHESGGLKWFKELASGDDYEGRADLGNTQPGDGKRFKGAGAIQLTGRFTYQSFSNYIKDPRVMEGCDYVAANFPFTSSGYWWYLNNMNSVCDLSHVTVEMVTLRVNGGLNGLEERIHYYERARKVVP